MPRTPVNSRIVARTRAAAHILDTTDLLAKWRTVGGLDTDLTFLREVGARAEVLGLAHDRVRDDGEVPSAEVLSAFADLTQEHRRVMAVVRAVLGDLALENKPDTLMVEVERILATDSGPRRSTRGSAARGKKGRRGPKSTQETQRTEIHEAAEALLALTDLHARLQARRVGPERLTTLRDQAAALTGALATRKAKKGASKHALAEAHALVAQHTTKWASLHDLLCELAARDERVRLLLKQAADA